MSKNNNSLPRRTFLHRVGKTIGIIIGVLSFISLGYGYYEFFVPHVSIGTSRLIQSDNPFYYPFTIKNNGRIKIVNFSFDLKIVQLSYKEGIVFSNNTFDNADLAPFKDTLPRIKAGGSHQIDLIKEINMNFTEDSARIFIRYKYSTPVIKIEHSDSIQFFLIKNDENDYAWIESQY